MEFTCVLSVGGSLAYYVITKLSDTAYTATLKDGTTKREDLPEVIRLEKGASGWQGEPSHDEVVKGLSYAIETAL